MLKVIMASEVKLAESWAYRGTLVCTQSHLEMDIKGSPIAPPT